MSHPLKMVQRLRADEVSAKGNPSVYQQVAPATADDYYLVPKVID
jgi:aspartyl-tRNA(Asn)/glutamyl-tRNA(Gln) amidotransferase subunit C